MKSFVYFGICCTALFGALQAEEFPVEEVLEMAERNSEVRKEWVLTRDIKPIRAQEIENTARLKEIIARHGLPSGYEMDELVPAITQLVLHSSDLAFQQQYLEMIPSAGDLWSEVIDVITDRVLLRQGLPQRYGTHLYHEAGTLVPYPIEDLEKADQLREEVDEPPFTEYLEIMGQIDQAIVTNNAGDLAKIFFNMEYEVDKNPADSLYYASFEPNTQPQEEGGFLAFEDPVLAAGYALCKTTVSADCSYASDNSCLMVNIYPQSMNDVALLQAPLYVYIIPRGDYQPHKPYNELFLNRLLISSQAETPVVEIRCGSVIELLIMGDSIIKLSGNGLEYEFKETYMRDTAECFLFFDMTLENENFEM